MIGVQTVKTSRFCYERRRYGERVFKIVFKQQTTAPTKKEITKNKKKETISVCFNYNNNKIMQKNIEDKNSNNI